MYAYTLEDSNLMWGNSNTCTTLAITNTTTGETRQIQDFTYFEEDTDTQEELALLYAEAA